MSEQLPLRKESEHIDSKDIVPKKTYSDESYRNDIWFYRIAILALSGTLFLGMVGVLLLSWIGKTIPENYVLAISTGIVGVLGGLFGSRHSP